MEISQDAESVVRSWLPTTPKQNPAKAFTQITPRPDRLGLGAETAGISREKVSIEQRIQRKLSAGNKRQRSDKQRGHATASNKTMLSQRATLAEDDSGSDEECSKSIIVSGSKTRPPTFTIDDLTGDPKRKRRRKRKKSKQVSSEKETDNSETQNNDSTLSGASESADSMSHKGTASLITDSKPPSLLTELPTITELVKHEIISAFPESVQLELGFEDGPSLTVQEIIMLKAKENSIKRMTSQTKQDLSEAIVDRTPSTLSVTDSMSSQANVQSTRHTRLRKRRRRKLYPFVQQSRLSLVDRLFPHRQYWTVQ